MTDDFLGWALHLMLHRGAIFIECNFCIKKILDFILGAR